jgi:SAM-dependent methyltransferase
MPPTSSERDYVLGTHDDEILRLALQHRVWRARALDAWRRAGFTVGQTLLDVGCGPGYASIDLAEIVGPDGRVVAIDRSRRFLETLDAASAQRGLDNIEPHELDLDDDDLPRIDADGAWCRWVFAFLARPHDLVARIAAVLKPGATFVLHEYFDYSTWRMAPRCPELEDFVDAVMESWRANGGEPDIGLELPQFLDDAGFRIVNLRPIVDIVAPTSYTWEWLATFVQHGARRLAELDRLTMRRAAEISCAVGARAADRHTLMITPGVLEIVAVRR